MKLLHIMIIIFFSQNLFSQSFYDKIDSVKSCNYKLENIIPITDGKTKFRRAILSPDSKQILLFSKENTELMNIESKEIIETYANFYSGQWIDNSAILVRESNTFKVLQTRIENGVVDLPIPELKFEEGHILVAQEFQKKWTIANIEGNENLFCYGYLFSNDFKKTVIYTNSGKDYIYSMDGLGLISVNEYGISCDWSDDNIEVISFIGLDFGEHYTVESDLYIHNTNSKTICKLTDSKDVLEKFPSWSGNKISYIDEKTNIVYVADLKEIE